MLLILRNLSTFDFILFLPFDREKVKIMIGLRKRNATKSQRCLPLRDLRLIKGFIKDFKEYL
jgi:hypothetical protein